MPCCDRDSTTTSSCTRRGWLQPGFGTLMRVLRLRLVSLLTPSLCVHVCISPLFLRERIDPASPESLHRAFAEADRLVRVELDPYCTLHSTRTSHTFVFLPLSPTDIALLLSDLLIVNLSPACRRSSERLLTPFHCLTPSMPKVWTSESLYPLPLCFPPDLMPCISFTTRQTEVSRRSLTTTGQQVHSALSPSFLLTFCSTDAHETNLLIVCRCKSLDCDTRSNPLSQGQG